MVALALRGCHRFFPVIWASILSVTSYIPVFGLASLQSVCQAGTSPVHPVSLHAPAYGLSAVAQGRCSQPTLAQPRAVQREPGFLLLRRGHAALRGEITAQAHELKSITFQTKTSECSGPAGFLFHVHCGVTSQGAAASV